MESVKSFGGEMDMIKLCIDRSSSWQCGDAVRGRASRKKLGEEATALGPLKNVRPSARGVKVGQEEVERKRHPRDSSEGQARWNLGLMFPCLISILL